MNDEMNKLEERLGGMLQRAARSAPAGPDPDKVLGALRRRTLRRRAAAGAGGLAVMAVVAAVLLHGSGPTANPPAPRQEAPQVAADPHDDGIASIAAQAPAIDFPAMSMAGPGAESRLESSLPAFSLSDAPTVSSSDSSGQISFPKMTMSGL